MDPAPIRCHFCGGDAVGVVQFTTDGHNLINLSVCPSCRASRANLRMYYGQQLDALVGQVYLLSGCMPNLSGVCDGRR